MDGVTTICFKLRIKTGTCISKAQNSRGDGKATVTFKAFSKRKYVVYWRNAGVLQMKSSGIVE